MRKKMLSVGLGALALAMVLSPATAEAKNNSKAVKSKGLVHELQCKILEKRIHRQFAHFDQYNEKRVSLLQGIINKKNNNQCPTNGTIVETLVRNGNFKTLVTAVTSAGLVDALSAPGDKTVFAPTDQAFSELPEGAIESLLADIPLLTNILTYHVVGGSVNGETASTLTEATMLNGKTVKVMVMDGKIYVNDSQVVLYDIMTDNGIIHVIDTVLIPN